MKVPSTHFTLSARLLHWTMAAMIVAMLFIGIGMVTTVSAAHDWLLAIHKPLGMTILLLALIRLGVRIRHSPPALPSDLPLWQKTLAKASHWLFYGLMVAMPLIGWAMLSAANEPIILGGSMHLPAIFPANPRTFAVLRQTHTVFALFLLVLVLGHLGAALHHGLIRGDGVLRSMWRRTRHTGRGPR